MSKPARLYGELEFGPAQAHYLVRLSQEERANHNESQAERCLKQALKAYPGSVEAWLERLIHLYDLNDGDRLAKPWAKRWITCCLNFVLLCLKV